LATDDHGIETIRKAGEEITPADKSDYYIKVGGHPSTSLPAIPVSGSFVLASTGPVKITGTTVGDVSAAYPSTNQTGRAALSIRNVDKNDPIYVVNSTGISKATAGVDIWEIGPNETFNTDFDDTNKINLVSESGKTVSIQIMEIKG